jgi:hypothetical protein
MAVRVQSVMALMPGTRAGLPRRVPPSGLYLACAVLLGLLVHAWHTRVAQEPMASLTQHQAQSARPRLYSQGSQAPNFLVIFADDQVGAWSCCQTARHVHHTDGSSGCSSRGCTTWAI